MIASCKNSTKCSLTGSSNGSLPTSQITSNESASMRFAMKRLHNSYFLFSIPSTRTSKFESRPVILKHCGCFETNARLRSILCLLLSAFQLNHDRKLSSQKHNTCGAANSNQCQRPTNAGCNFIYILFYYFLTVK